MSDMEKYESMTNEELNSLIQKDDTSAMREMAWRLKKGEKGLGVSLEKAFKIYLKAAELGNDVAQYNVGSSYEFGDGIECDYNKAFFWYKKAAEAGDVDAQSRLAYFYENGKGIEKDENSAFYWYKKAAEAGSSWDMHGLGLCYLNGIGTKVDNESALLWFTKSAENDCEFPNFYLGQMYEKGIGTLQDYDKAMYYYKNVTENERIDSYFWIACILTLQGKHDKDLEWYIKAAELGNSDSIDYLAGGYWVDKDCEIDYSIALKWAEKGANNGSSKNMAQSAFTMPFSVTKNFKRVNTKVP